MIDRDLNGLRTTLGTLATSTRLPIGDFEGFQSQAERVAKITGANIVLRATNGQQLMNTAYPWGTALTASRTWNGSSPGRT